MDLTGWLQKLNSWGLKEALHHPKIAVAFYIAIAVIRWVALALAIAVAVVAWLLLSVIASALKGR